jgi:hypothetical protein
MKELRQFGVCGLLVLSLLAWWINFPWLAVAGLVLGALALLAPRALRPIYFAATLATAPVGMVLGELLLATIYFLVFTPLAIVFRLIGRDALRRRLDPNETTYWVPRAQPGTSLEYYRQS